MACEIRRAPRMAGLGPLETGRRGKNPTNKRKPKGQSVFPGIAGSVTVEGSYQNLRHFLRDLEASRQFLIVNAVELETATQSSAAPAGEGTAPAGQRTGIVSLRLDLATYFQREATESAGAAE